MRWSRVWWLGLLLWSFGVLQAQEREGITIVSYNVENFFDCHHDTLKSDTAFLPGGQYRWTYSRFVRKAEQIARVIANIGGFTPPAIVGLCEVENVDCLAMLCHKMPLFPYRYIHKEGPDKRGIDVALLYDTTRIVLSDTAFLSVPLRGAFTRDILYAKCIWGCDTFHLFLCHLPSMSGSPSDTEWKRRTAKSIIKCHADSILGSNPDAKIVVMGDMNSSPKHDLPPLLNKMISYEKKGHGTEKYREIWSCLDQFYLSEAMDTLSDVSIYDAPWLLEEDKTYLGVRPKRTFRGYRYQKDGFSDHLPIVLNLRSVCVSDK